MSGLRAEATEVAVRNPQYTMKVQMVCIAQRVVPISVSGKTSAGYFRQGTDGHWHIALPVHARFVRRSLRALLRSEAATVAARLLVSRYRCGRAALDAEERSGPLP